jgi:hypothetical protein
LRIAFWRSFLAIDDVIVDEDRNLWRGRPIAVHARVRWDADDSSAKDAWGASSRPPPKEPISAHTGTAVPTRSR